MSSSKRIVPAMIALVAALAPAAASAQFVNPGFELPVTPNGGVIIYGGGDNIAGWAVVGTQVMLVNTNYVEPGNGVAGATQTFASHSGLASLDLSGSGNNGISAGVQQSLVTLPGQSYAISFWVGKATGGQFYATPSTVDVSIDGGARVGYTNSNNVPSIVNWELFTHTFTAASASTLVTFYNGTAGGDNNLVGLDDVSMAAVASTVPEPATIALLLAGAPLLGLAGWRRRRA